MSQYFKKMIAVYSAIIFFVGLDRCLKILALINSGRQFNLIDDLLKFNFKANYYVAFSLPLAGKLLAVIISLIIIALILSAARYAQRQEYSKLLPLSLIILGAGSNLWDRIKYGYVIDYLDLKYFTIFNLADAMIVIGTMLFIFFYKKRG